MSLNKSSHLMYNAIIWREKSQNLLEIETSYLKQRSSNWIMESNLQQTLVKNIVIYACVVKYWFSVNSVVQFSGIIEDKRTYCIILWLLNISVLWNYFQKIIEYWFFHKNGIFFCFSNGNYNNLCSQIVFHNIYKMISVIILVLHNISISFPP